MNVRFILNNKLIEVTKATDIELKMLTQIATGHNKKWVRGRDKKSRLVDDYKNFFTNYRYLPGGLWKRILELKTKGYTVNFENLEQFVRTEISEDSFNEWVESLPLKFKELRHYQAKGTYQALRFPYAKLELAPAAGKTLIIYLLSRYLLEKVLNQNGEKQKVLVVVPRTLLVKQMPKDFDDYSYDKVLRCSEVFATRTEHDDDNVVVGTMQTLSNCENKEWFAQFGAIIIDEGHQAQTKTISKILQMMPSMTTHQITGLSGTFYQPDTIEGVTVDSYLGATVLKVTHKQLEEDNYVPHVKINVLDCLFDRNDAIEYSKLFCDENGEEIENDTPGYMRELQFLNQHNKRTQLILDFVKTIDKNQLLMFNSKRDCTRFRDIFMQYTDKCVYMINGDVKLADRIRMLEDMETRDDVVLCAMYSTMSTGVSVKRLHALHTIDSTKSFIVLRQTIGRICRALKDKKNVHMYDWSATIPMTSDLIGPATNSVYKQMKARIKIYDEQEYEYTVKHINMNNIVDNVDYSEF